MEEEVGGNAAGRSCRVMVQCSFQSSHPTAGDTMQNRLDRYLCPMGCPGYKSLSTEPGGEGGTGKAAVSLHSA